MHALLHVAGLIKDQDRAAVAEGVDDVIPQIIAHGIGVPAGPRQRMLQPIGSRRTAVLSNGPAILSVRPETIPAISSPAWRSGS
jgi:hypothetical protein